MKKIFKGFAVLSIALFTILSIFSCGKEENVDRGVYLNTYLGAQPNTLDPSKGTDLYGNGVLLNILEPLVRYNSDDEAIIPAGAESWTLSDDGLVYTFKIRDMKWNDGKKLTSQDYAYGIRRSTDPATACPFANMMYAILNAEDIVNKKKDLSELGVETPDDSTLVIKLRSPSPYFLDTAMQRVFFPQRQDWVEKYGDKYATAPENSPMCGPFRLDNWEVNSVLNYVKNPDYWNVANVKLDTIHCQIINDPNTIFQALLSGELDLAIVNDPKWWSKFEDSSKWNRVVVPQADIVYWMLNCNNKYLKNTKIRQAISVAVDREDFVKTCRKGVGLPGYWFTPPSVTCQGLPFNTTETGAVRTLLANNPDPKALFEAGLKELGLNEKPEDVTIRYMSSDTTQDGRIELEYFQQQMKEKIGCNFEVEAKDWNEFINIVQSGNYEIAGLAWGADFNDPCNFLETAWSKNPAYPTGWVNKEFDALIEKAQISTDATERKELLLKAEDILINTDCAIIPQTTRTSYSFRAPYVKNASNNYFDWMGLQRIDTSSRNEKK